MAPVVQTASVVLIASSQWFSGAHWQDNTLSAAVSPWIPGVYVGPAPSTTTAAPSATETSSSVVPTSGACRAGYVACSNYGGFVCAGEAQFGICAMDGCALVQDLAPGTSCSIWESVSSASPASVMSLTSMPSSTTSSTGGPTISSSPQSSPMTTSVRTTSSLVSSSSMGATSPGTASSSTTSSTSSSISSKSTSTTTDITGVLPTAIPPSEFKYQNFTGNGTDFPTESLWISSFEQMWQLNAELMALQCVVYGANSESETVALRNAIVSASSSSGLDPRFVLAVVMQESRGCVRVITTFGSHANPGLLQDNQGNATCNPGDGVAPIIPCPATEINQMIEDGVFGMQIPGKARGDGLLQTYQEAAAFPFINSAVQYYIAARIYNSGSYDGKDLGCGSGTSCYASDVANRLIGWTGDVSPCLNFLAASQCTRSNDK